MVDHQYVDRGLLGRQAESSLLLERRKNGRMLSLFGTALEIHEAVRQFQGHSIYALESGLVHNRTIQAEDARGKLLHQPSHRIVMKRDSARRRGEIHFRLRG